MKKYHFFIDNRPYEVLLKILLQVYNGCQFAECLHFAQTGSTSLSISLSIILFYTDPNHNNIE